jgi:hypothetical protein
VWSGKPGLASAKCEDTPPGHLLLHAPTFEAIKADKPLARIRVLWQKDLDEFMKRRAKYLIY